MTADTGFKSTADVALAQAIESIGPLSNSVVKLFQLLNAPEPDVRQIEQSINQDPGLVARVLRIVNSPIFAPSREVSSVREAVVMLGLASLHQVILTGVVVHHFPQHIFDDFDYRRFWRHSMGVAATAMLLAKLRREDPYAAFTAGLLHDIGRLVIRCAFDSERVNQLYAQVGQQSTAHVLENAEFGFSHALAGQMLAMKWGFPLVLQQAIGLHHATHNGQLPKLVHIVHVADFMVQSFDLGEWPEGGANMEFASWSALRMNEADFDQILDSLKEMDLSVDAFLD